MAIIKIANATVERIFASDKGVRVSESFQKRDGTEGRSYYTLWFNEPVDFDEGFVGDFSGLHSARVDEYTNKDGDLVRTAAVNVNSARLDKAGGSSAPADDDDRPF